MACLKCGRETNENNSFCEDCLAVMAQYPVKPGIAIQLLQRPEREPEKETDRKKRSAADSIRQLRRINLLLVVINFLLLLGVAVLVWILLH